MAGPRRFKATIREASRGGAFVTVPFDVEEAFGKERVKVNATIDGEPYRGSLVRLGGPDHVLGVLKAIREKIGKRVGDAVEVTLEEYTEPRVVEIPVDLGAAFKKNPRARKFFDSLSYTHRKEYARWMESAVKAETRASRIERAIRMMLDGKRAV